MTLAPSTRASLLLRLGNADDHAAWVEFATLYEPVVYRLLRHRGLQDVDARDVIQDLFLAISRNIDRWQPYREKGSFRAWLRRVARNLVINWLKSPQRRDLCGESDLHVLLDQLPAASEPETAEFDREVHRALFQQASQRVQADIQPATWQAFWETSVAGLSTAAAAAKLGMSVGAVRVARCRVTARIKDIVAAMEKAK